MLALIVGGLLLTGADGCSSDPNVEGAKLDLRNKDYDRALKNLEIALQKNPENGEAWKYKGITLQEILNTIPPDSVDKYEQTFQEMIAAYQKAMELLPEQRDEIAARMLQAWATEMNKGVQAFNKASEDSKYYEIAAMHFHHATELEPDSVSAYVNEGLAYIAAGKHDKAIPALETAIKKGDRSPDTYIYLAELYMITNQPEKAVQLLEKARELFPDNEEISTRLLNAYILSNQIDRAMEVYAEEVEKHPDNKLYLYNYGSLLLQAGRYDEAIKYLKKAVELDSTYTNAWYNLGAAYQNKAVDIQDELDVLEDKLTDKSLSEEERKELERKIEELRKEQAELLRQALPYLERARQLMEASGEDTKEVCQALFRSYAHLNMLDKAEEAAKCAGIELD